MELIAKISKGTLMDQIYIPKNRAGLETGSYVLIKSAIPEQKQAETLNFHNTNYLEPIKIEIARKTFRIISNAVNCENIIITGSFLNRGFNFNDLDIIILSKTKDTKNLKELIEKKIGIDTHILSLTNQDLLAGLKTDPLYQAMLDKYIAKKKIILNIKNEPNYKILDLHLMKSKLLIDNFEILTGKEKYNLTRNLIAIKLFLENKKVTNSLIDLEIENQFKLKGINELKNNLIKREFARTFKEIYQKTFKKIIEKVKNGPK